MNGRPTQDRKLPEESVGESFDIAFGNTSLEMAPKAQAIKAKKCTNGTTSNLITGHQRKQQSDKAIPQNGRKHFRTTHLIMPSYTDDIKSSHNSTTKATHPDENMGKGLEYTVFQRRYTKGQ